MSLPHELVSAACEEGHAWDTLAIFDHAEVLFSGDVPWALECDLYDFGISDHRRSLVDLRHATAAVERIRNYLIAHGVPVPVQNVL